MIQCHIGAAVRRSAISSVHLPPLPQSVPSPKTSIHSFIDWPGKSAHRLTRRRPLSPVKKVLHLTISHFYTLSCIVHLSALAHLQWPLPPPPPTRSNADFFQLCISCAFWLSFLFLPFSGWQVTASLWTALLLIHWDGHNSHDTLDSINHSVRKVVVVVCAVVAGFPTTVQWFEHWQLFRFRYSFFFVFFVLQPSQWHECSSSLNFLGVSGSEHIVLGVSAATVYQRALPL